MIANKNDADNVYGWHESKHLHLLIECVYKQILLQSNRSIESPSTTNRKIGNLTFWNIWIDANKKTVLTTQINRWKRTRKWMWTHANIRLHVAHTFFAFILNLQQNVYAHICVHVCVIQCTIRRNGHSETMALKIIAIELEKHKNRAARINYFSNRISKCSTFEKQKKKRSNGLALADGRSKWAFLNDLSAGWFRFDVISAVHALFWWRWIRNNFG